MWMINPKLLCRKHLLGEHVELHMLVGAIRKGRSIEGFVRDNLVATADIASRHRALADEMRRRGYNHASPLVYRDALRAGRVDRRASLIELRRRCAECRERMS